ncbi:hypothetical protein ACFL2H_10855 [Planctomycetota bacterium]
MLLQPNQYIVVAENAAAFTQRYGRAVNLAGEYSGSLSNGGETIALQFAAPFNAAILRFAYDDAWYPKSDGQGSSLEIINAAMRFDAGWSEKSSWKASPDGGTPGGNTPIDDP